MVNGDPATVVSAPVLLLIVYAEMSPEVLLVMYRNLPAGSVTTAEGAVFVANGEPVTAVRLPFCRFTEKADTLLDPEFATYKNSPLGVTVTPVDPCQPQHSRQRAIIRWWH